MKLFCFSVFCFASWLFEASHILQYQESSVQVFIMLADIHDTVFLAYIANMGGPLGFWKGHLARSQETWALTLSLLLKIIKIVHTPCVLILYQTIF